MKIFFIFYIVKDFKFFHQRMQRFYTGILCLVYWLLDLCYILTSIHTLNYELALFWQMFRCPSCDGFYKLKHEHKFVPYRKMAKYLVLKNWTEIVLNETCRITLHARFWSLNDKVCTILQNKCKSIYLSIRLQMYFKCVDELIYVLMIIYIYFLLIFRVF